MAYVADSEFSDMPNLASYRPSDDRSVGSSHRTDCDMSLPSLSSFRLEDLSLASSYHSRGSAATNHLSNFSEESAEGWGSFTSGNVSKSDTDSEDCITGVADGETDSSEFAIRSSIRSLEEELIRLSVASASAGTASATAHPTITTTTTEAKSILRNRGETMSSSASASSLRSSEDRATSILKRPGGGSTKSLEGQGRDQNQDQDRNSTRKEIEPETVANLVDVNPRHPSPPRKTFHHNASEVDDSSNLPLRTVRRAPSNSRFEIERNDSLPLTDIKRPTRLNNGELPVPGSGSSSTCRADGSSSSLKGGDSVPRLPRRTSTMAHNVDCGNNDASGWTIRGSDAGNEALGDQDLSSSSEGDLSLAVDRDGDDSDDCSVQTLEEDVLSVVDDTDAKSSRQVISSVSDIGNSLEQLNRMCPSTSSTQDSTLIYQDSETTQLVEKVAQHVDGNQKSQSRIQSTDTTGDASTSSTSKKPNGEESGTSATDDENEETIRNKQQQQQIEEEQGKGKRGNLLRRMSSTLAKVGRSASFRDLAKIGRKASKIRQRSTREPKVSTQKVPVPPSSK